MTTTYTHSSGAVLKEWFYLKEDGLFAFYGGFGEYQGHSESVAIAYDQVLGTLHKHGSPGMVNKWAFETRKALQNSADKASGSAKDIFESMASDMVVIESTEWDVDEQNWLLACTGSLPEFLKKDSLDKEGGK